MAREAIFIGYRREDTADVAGRIYDALAQRFGRLGCASARVRHADWKPPIPPRALDLRAKARHATPPCPWTSPSSS